MIDYQRLFHLGVRVNDVDAAMSEMTRGLGVSWAAVQHNPAQHVWTPQEGLREVPLTFVYSCEGPQHIELLQAPSGTLWHGGDQAGAHHVGVWVDDIAAETQQCLDAGWTLAAAGAAPDDGFGVFTYLVPPSGLIVELVWSAVQPRFEQWWAGGSLGNDRAAA